MNSLHSKLGRLLPSQELARALGVDAGRAGPADLRPGADLRGVDLRGRTVDGADGAGAVLHGLRLEGARLTRADLSEAEIAHADARGAAFVDCDLSDARLTVMHGEDLTIEGGTLDGALITGAALARCRLVGVDLSGAQIAVADLFASDWRGVAARGVRMRGVDLSWSTFHRVDLAEADLRGCILAHCAFEEVDLSAARLDGADLRGAKGLSAEQRRVFRGQGARLAAPGLEGVLELWLERRGVEAERAGRIGRWLALGLQALVVGGALGVSYALFKDRVVPPSEAQISEQSAVAAPHEPTSGEVEETRRSLATLRAAIQAARETTARYGVATWPRLSDLSENTFDRDGDGPETLRVPLVEGGLPPNLLTQGDAILPYCNDVATQETLSGDDSDWHYCEETGRIYACGGFTTEATLQW